MGLDSIIVRQITSVAKNSGKLDATVDKIKSKVLDQGLGLLQETGINPTLIPVNIPAFLRGEVTVDPSTLINPTIICNQPTIPIQKRESSTRLINNTIEEIEGIYTTTQSIKEQLIVLQKPINALQKSIGSVSNTVNTISGVITTIKLLPFPVAVAGIGIPANVLTIYSSLLDSMDKLLLIAKSNLSTLPKAISAMAKTINSTIEKVNSLNLIIDPLLQFLQLCASIIVLQDNCPNVTQESINNVKNNLTSDIEGSLATTSNFEINSGDLYESLLPNANPGYFYKNFRFTLQNEQYFDSDGNSIPSPYILSSRRIKCVRSNSTGISDNIGGYGKVTLYNNGVYSSNPYSEEGEYSYSSDLQVLVNEARFAVDVYTDQITLWEAPQTRPNVVKISDSYFNLADATDDELEKLASRFGYESVEEFINDPNSPVNTYQSLPNYIVYGSNYVNLNSSPTNIAFGANRLFYLGRTDDYAGTSWYEREFNEGGTVNITSYIQSGTIQVNSPINIKMKTYGGYGNPIEGIPRFTEAVLTIKRSFNIQDDVNPFTGKLIGAESVNDNIESFENKYGKYTERLKSIDILNTVYETFNEGITMDDDIIIGELTQILENGGTVDPFQLQNLSNRQQLLFIETVLTEEIFQSNQISLFINQVYEKFYFLLPNIPTLALSEKLYNSNFIYSYLEDLFKIPKAKINKQLKKLINDNQNNIVVNWWKLARYTQYSGFENREYTKGSTTEKSIILTFLSLSSRQWIAEWNNIYGSRQNYNNGAWVGGSSTIPIIPTQVGEDNADITIPIQVTQLAGNNETINEIIGGLDLLGTYSYDLEIINSNPAIGGESSSYPTNYTTFTIEDKDNPLI
jgi:hypothetical protein